MRPRETAKTKLIRLLFFASDVLTLGLCLALCYLGGSQQVDPEARARTANRTAALVPAGPNGTLAGAEANAAPYSRMLMIGVLIVLESLLGIVGALRTQKHRDRRRGGDTASWESFLAGHAAPPAHRFTPRPAAIATLERSYDRHRRLVETMAKGLVD